MIYVLRTDGGADKYASATKWHIDEFHMLHILEDKRGIGSYSGGHWASVHVAKDDSWANYPSAADL